MKDKQKTKDHEFAILISENPNSLNPEEAAALESVIEYLWKDKLKDLQQSFGNEHIAFDLIVLKDWLSKFRRNPDGRLNKK